MLFYSWTRMTKATGSDARELVKVFKMLALNQVPKNFKDPLHKYSTNDFSGTSFILHADVLANNANKYRDRDVAMYCALASLRKIGDYVAEADVRLDMLLVSIEGERLADIVDQNPLLSEEEGRIVFLYEEVGSQTIH